MTFNENALQRCSAGGQGECENGATVVPFNLTPAPESVKNDSLIANPNEIRKHLTILHPDGPWALSAKLPPKGAKFDGRVFSDLDRAVEWAVERNVSGRNIYVSNAALSPGWQGVKASKADVAGSRWLWEDLDPRAREKLKDEQERIDALLSDNLPDGVPPPSLVLDSGRGRWRLWQLPALLAGVEDIEGRNLWPLGRTAPAQSSTEVRMQHPPAKSAASRFYYPPGPVSPSSEYTLSVLI